MKKNVVWVGVRPSWVMYISYDKKPETKDSWLKCLNDNLVSERNRYEEQKASEEADIVFGKPIGYLSQQLAQSIKLIELAIKSLNKHKGDDLKTWRAPPQCFVKVWKCTECGQQIIGDSSIKMHHRTILHRRHLWEKRNPDWVRYGGKMSSWLATYTNVKYMKAHSYRGVLMYVNIKYIPAIEAWENGLKDTFEGNFTKYMKTTFGRLT